MLAQQGSTQTYQQGDWLWPVETRFHYITTYFGWDSWRSGNHYAIDIGDGGINGTNIYASKGGVVITAKDTYIPGYSYGKYVVIDHGEGYSTIYAHCSAIYVYEGQAVNQGDVIAAVGSTGWSTGPHLHFGVYINGVAQDPFNYVNYPG
ncbi:MAG: M23 family metallopeptidase [Bacteroides sp.]|nr:M23 family metallopeptidase [Bacteroides sp.]